LSDFQKFDGSDTIIVEAKNIFLQTSIEAERRARERIHASFI